MKRWNCGAFVTFLLVAGCSSSPKYGCGVPDGVTCKSISTVYRETEGDARRKPTYEGQEGPADEKSKSKNDTYKPALAGERAVGLPAIKPGDPIRVEPRILRVWLSPWEDQDEVFHDQSFIYVIVDQGRWQISQNRGLLENAWRSRTVKPPKNRSAEPQDDASGTAPKKQPQAPAGGTVENRTAIKALEMADRKAGGAP